MKNCIIFSQLNFKKIAAKGLILISVFVFLSCEKTDPSVDYADIVSGSYNVTEVRNGSNIATLPSGGISGRMRVNRVDASSVSIEFTFTGIDIPIPTAIYAVRGGDNANELDFFGNGTFVATYYIDDRNLWFSPENGVFIIGKK